MLVIFPRFKRNHRQTAVNGVESASVQFIAVKCTIRILCAHKTRSQFYDEKNITALPHHCS